MKRVHLLIAVSLLTLAQACADAPANPGADEGTATTSPAPEQASSSTTPPVVSTGQAVPPAPTNPPPEPSEPVAAEPTAIWTVETAVSINVASNAGHAPVLGWITDDAVFLAEWPEEADAPSEPVAVHGSVTPFAHPIERPAIVVDDQGVIHFAFTSLTGSGGSVYHGRLSDGEIDGPVLVSGDPEPETNLVHASLDLEGDPVLAWLEDSTLSVAPSNGGQPAEIENVDELTCDCCNPSPVAHPDGLVVLYRDLERSGETVIRNVVATVRDGTDFSPAIPVADDDWNINACPFSGPAALNIDGEIVVTWMDARQSVHPAQDGTTIWVDRSGDGGRTFGTDTAISGPGIHRWPVLAHRDDILHVVWQAEGAEGGILYRGSTDGGRTFGPTVALSANADPGGTRRSPSVAVDGASLLVTWVDQSGAHAARFDIAALTPQP